MELHESTTGSALTARPFILAGLAYSDERGLELFAFVGQERTRTDFADVLLVCHKHRPSKLRRLDYQPALVGTVQNETLPSPGIRPPD